MRYNKKLVVKCVEATSVTYSKEGKEIFRHETITPLSYINEVYGSVDKYKESEYKAPNTETHYRIIESDEYSDIHLNHVISYQQSRGIDVDALMDTMTTITIYDEDFTLDDLDEAISDSHGKTRHILGTIKDKMESRR